MRDVFLRAMIFFRPDAQRTLLHQGHNMFCITRNDVRLICFGRTVGCTDPTADSHPIVAALVRLKGPRIIPAYQTKRFRRFVKNWTEMVSRRTTTHVGFQAKRASDSNRHLCELRIAQRHRSHFARRQKSSRGSSKTCLCRLVLRSSSARQGNPARRCAACYIYRCRRFERRTRLLCRSVRDMPRRPPKR